MTHELRICLVASSRFPVREPFMGGLEAHTHALAGELVRRGHQVSLFAAPATLDDDYDIGAEAYEEVAGKIRSTAPLVVLDLPHLWSNWMRRVLLASDEVVIVATPDR